MEYTCPVCNKPMKFIPAGTAKSTGRPYNAFYACSVYGCKGSRREDGSVKQQFATKPYTQQEAKDVAIEKHQKEKEEAVRITASGTAAKDIVVALIGQGSAWTDEQIQERIKTWQTFFYTKVYNDDPLRGV